MNNIQQNLLQAIDLIAINQASAVNFDTTEIATVLSKLENGNYWVSNGKVKYEAKSTETISYTENTQVYVSVSQGDYSQDKVIMGRYDNRNEDEKAYLYEDPYQRLGVSHIATVTLTDENEISFLPTALGQPTLLGIETSVNANTKPEDGVGYYGLQINLLNTNEETLMSFIIDSRNFIGNPYNMVSGIKHKNIFTLPNDFNISDVKKIDVISYGDGAKDTDDDGIEWSPITLRFGYDLESEIIVNSESKAFIGTDNGLNTYGDGDNDSYREVLIKKFDKFNDNTTANINNISEFDNDLNTKNAFKCGNGSNSALCQIFLDEEAQGFDLETNIKYQIKFKYFVKTNSIYVGTNNNKVYSIAGMYQTNNFFGNTINLDKDPGQWHEAILDFVINSSNQSYGFAIKLNFGGPENYLGDTNPYIYIKDFEIYKLQPIPLNNLYFSWVKDGQVYNPNNPITLETSVSWYKYVPNKIDEDLGIGWEKIENENVWTLDVSNNYLDHNIPEERFRARLVYNDVDCLSNVLVLKNKDYVGETAAAVSPTMTLRLNDDGIYLYDHTAQLYETEKTLKTISASSNAGFEDDYKDLYWLIPKNSTMIAAPKLLSHKTEDVVDYWYWDYLPDIHFANTSKPTDFTSSVSDLKDYNLDTNNYYIIGGNGIKFEQNIYIKRSYQPNYLNNTIQCKAFFGDTTTANEEGSIDLKFVSANNSGVEASLGIELVSDKGYFGGDNHIEDEQGNKQYNPIELKGVVYDKNGIPFDNQPEIFFESPLSLSEFYQNQYIPSNYNWSIDTTNNYKFTNTSQESEQWIQLIFKNNGNDSIQGTDADQSIEFNNITFCNFIIKSNCSNIYFVEDSPRDTDQSNNNIFISIGEPKEQIEVNLIYTTFTSDIVSYETSMDEDNKVSKVQIQLPRGCKFWLNCYANASEDTTIELVNKNVSIANNIISILNQFQATNIKVYCNWNSETTNQEIQLSSYYTIPYYPTETVYHLDSATQISYSSFGDNPKPSRSINYKLFDSSNNEIEDFYMEFAEPDAQPQISNHRINMPTLAPAEETIYTLNIYENPSKENLLAQYPIILLRNTYAFKEINAWGGSTVTTEDYVISPMIGAGSKNSQNQFTGVIMGTSSEFPSTGLYGFQNGVATFGFKEDGSCFLGANEETGRIEFNTGDSGGGLVINAQIKRKGKFSFDKDYVIKSGQTEITLSEVQSISSEDYIENNIFCGLSFKMHESKGYMGQAIGYWENDDIYQNNPRFLGLMLCSDSMLSISAPNGIYLGNTTTGFGFMEQGNAYIQISTHNSINIHADDVSLGYYDKSISSVWGLNYNKSDKIMDIQANKLIVATGSGDDNKLLDLGNDLIIKRHIRAKGGVIYLGTGNNFNFLQINDSYKGNTQLHINLSGTVLDIRPPLDTEDEPGIYWDGTRVVKFLGYN